MYKSMLFFICGVLLITASTSQALVFLDDGQTHNLDYDFGDSIYVDYESPGTQTVVNVLEGGQSYGIRAWEDSKVYVYEGTILGSVDTAQRAQAYIFGGTIKYGSYSYDNSQITIQGGTIGEYPNTAFWVQHNSQMTFSGGVIKCNVDLFDNSQIYISGGIFESYIAAGYLTEEIDTAVITMEGSNFEIDGQPLGYGQYYNIGGRLTGTLANGDLIDVDTLIVEDCSLILVPEPSILFLLGLGVLILRKRRNFC